MSTMNIKAEIHRLELRDAAELVMQQVFPCPRPGIRRVSGEIARAAKIRRAAAAAKLGTSASQEISDAAKMAIAAEDQGTRRQFDAETRDDFTRVPFAGGFLEYF